MSYIREYRCEMYLLILLAVLSSAAGQETNGRIMGRSNAILGQNQYHASLQNDKFFHLCSGAIISDRWILTSTGCVEITPKYVVVGSTTHNPPGSRYEVSVYIVHWLRRFFHYKYDIGLLKTQTVIAFVGYVQPIALATQDIPDGTVLKYTGWGSLIYPEMVYPNDLQTLDMKKLNQQVCHANLTVQKSIHVFDTMMCLQKGPVVEGICVGDPGGPAVHNNILYGIGTNLNYCYEIPDVFIRVTSFGFWIWFNQLIYFWA